MEGLVGLELEAMERMMMVVMGKGWCDEVGGWFGGA